jgi:hypothetical protein
MIVAKHLYLDVARRGYVFLDKNAVIAEAGLAFALRTCQRIGKIRRALNLAHALATAARTRLDQHRVADVVSDLCKEVSALLIAVIARHHRHACRLHQRLGSILQAHRADGGSRRADKRQPGSFDGLDEARVFRKETIARMDGVSAGCLRSRQNGFNVQVAFGAAAGPTRTASSASATCIALASASE